MKKNSAPETSGLKAVFFDAGNTLFRPYPSVGRVYGRLARAYGVRAPSRWIQERFAAEWSRRNGLASLKDEGSEREWWRRLVRAVFGDRFQDERTFDRYYDRLFKEFAHPRTWRLYADALPTLRALRRRGIKMGIVSNWDSRLFRLCDGLRVTDQVDFILASAVEGAVKPERALFQRALRKAGVRAKEALHVGDSFREDYWGARRAGLRARLLCRDGARRPEADCVMSLKELIQLAGT